MALPLIPALLAGQATAEAWRLGKEGIRDIFSRDAVGRLLVILYNDYGESTKLSKRDFFSWEEDAEIRPELELVVAGRRADTEADIAPLGALVTARLPNEVEDAATLGRHIAQDAIAIASFVLKSPEEIGRYLVAKVGDLDAVLSEIQGTADALLAGQTELAEGQVQLLDGQELLASQVQQSEEKILEALAARPNTLVRYVRSDWGPEGTEAVLARLGDRDPEVLEKLQFAVGSPVAEDSLERLIAERPPWFRGAPIEAFIAVARLLEQVAKDWNAASQVWEDAARIAETAGQVADLLVRGAISANVGGDSRRYGHLLAEARKVDAEAPRLVLEEASNITDPTSTLDSLARVHTEDPQLDALIEAQRALAYLLRPDTASARYHLERATRRAPALKQLRLVRINVVVQEARVAVSTDQAVDSTALRDAATEARELRAELMEATRYEESGRVLMLLCDALAMQGEINNARELVKTASGEEIAAGQNAEVLAEVALRFGEYRLALEFLKDYPDTEGAVRQRAAATVQTGSSDAVRSALSRLREIALGDGQESMMAGANRLLSCIEKPQLDWDADVAQKMEVTGNARLAVGARALQLAKKHRYEDALDVLEPHLDNLWALEARLNVASLRGNSEELAAAANAVLDAGPDQPMTVLCGTALRQVGETARAAQILVGVARNPGAPVAVRSEAFHTLLLVVANDQGDWSRTDALWKQWRDLNTGDGRISAWYARIAVHKGQGTS